MSPLNHFTVSLSLRDPVRGEDYWAFFLKTLSLSEGMMEFVRWLKCLNPWTKSYGVIIQMKPSCPYILRIEIWLFLSNFAFGHIWQRKGYWVKQLWSFRSLTHRNKEVMKLFTGVELFWVVKLVRWQEFAQKFAVDIREGSHIVGKTWRNF